MAEANEAAAPATEATPTSTNNEPAQAPEQATAPEVNAEQVARYLGTNAETLNKFQKFVEANGQFDTAFSKMKAGISNPEPKPEEKPAEVSADVQSTQSQPAPQPTSPVKPQGRTNEEIMAEFYFEKLSQKPEYSTISGYIANGDVLTEMHNLGIPFRFADGSWDDKRINDFLKIKAQTVPAQPTSVEPNASTAPTVNYVDVGDKIENMEQAQAVFMQKGHPKWEDAKEFIKNQLNSKK